MTDKRLTCAQVNEEVAEMLGWTIGYRPFATELLWYPPGHHDEFDYLQPDPPDSCDDWQHAAPLFLELWADASRNKDVGIFVDEILIIQDELKCEFIEAAIRTWHAWKKEDEKL